ncbi:MAG: hypothetical protein WAU66_06180 [Methanoregula sp.]
MTDVDQKSVIIDVKNYPVSTDSLVIPEITFTAFCRAVRVIGD